MYIEFIKYNNMKIDEGIRKLIVLFLKEQIIFQSWGSYNLSVKYNRIVFYVKAFKYKGRISIESKKDKTFEIKVNGNKTKISEINEVIPFIDKTIECGDFDFIEALVSYIDRSSLPVERQ